MTEYSVSEKNKYRVSGITKEHLSGSQIADIAIREGVLNPKTDGWLIKVRVEEAFRGKDLGKKLVEGFHDHCLSLGLSRVLCIIASEENRQSDLENWYVEELGYRLEGLQVEGYEFVLGIKDL